jgi:ParB-like chromosome segregation protein Spo0J
MKVRTGSDGTGELINGRHRLFVARRMGIDSLPMDVR